MAILAKKKSRRQSKTPPQKRARKPLPGLMIESLPMRPRDNEFLVAQAPAKEALPSKNYAQLYANRDRHWLLLWSGVGMLTLLILIMWLLGAKTTLAAVWQTPTAGGNLATQAQQSWIETQARLEKQLADNDFTRRLAQVQTADQAKVALSETLAAITTTQTQSSATPVSEEPIATTTLPTSSYE